MLAYVIWPYMMNSIVRGFAVAAFMFAVAAMIVPMSFADSVSVNGQSCGNGVEWELNDGVMSITYTGSGTGMMDDFKPHSTPWEDRIQDIVTLSIGDGVTRIGEMAFSEAVNLSSVTIASSVESIGEFAFEACKSLKEVELPSNLKTIEYCAFIYSGLEALEIPDGTVSIGIFAFNQCEKLASVRIGSGVTDMGLNAFEGCISLKSIEVSSDNAVFASVQGVLCRPDIGTVIECPAGWDSGEFTVPDGYLVIGENAFEGCEGVTSVDLGPTVTTLESTAFLNCTNLESVKLSPGLTTIGESAFQFCTSLKKVAIPSTVTTIGVAAFRACNSLEEVVIPGSVSRIESDTFTGTGLKTVSISEGVKYIGGYAFSVCNSLESVSFPDSVETINYSVFDNSESLRFVSFGAGLKTLHNNALSNTPSVEEVTVSKDNQMYCSVNGILFSRDMTVLIYYPPAKSGTVYTVPSTVKTIQTLGFNTNESLISITLPNGLERISDMSFMRCKSLVSLSIPKTVKYIGSRAFCECQNLESIEFPPSIEAIKEATLSGCISLKSLMIPDSVAAIDFRAFEDCNSLSKIYVGTLVEKIVGDAFTARFFIDGKEVEATPKNLTGKTWVGAGTDQCFYVLGSGYTISFDAGQGTSTSDVMTTVDGMLPALPEATLDGKEFRGWLTDSGETVTTGMVFTSDTMVKASWEEGAPSSGFDMSIIVAVAAAIAVILVIGAVVYLKRP